MMVSTPLAVSGMALAIAFPALAEPAMPAITVAPQIETYDIAGATADELRQQMNTLGPVDKTEKKHFHALTTWRVSWHFRWERGAAYGCRITGVDTGLRAKIVMPHLLPSVVLPVDVRTSWNAYLEKLMLHEKGHVAIGEAARADAERSIRTLPAAATCEELERAANEAGNAAIRKANGDDIAYDRDTHHGATQGAKW